MLTKRCRQHVDSIQLAYYLYEQAEVLVHSAEESAGTECARVAAERICAEGVEADNVRWRTELERLRSQAP